MPKGQGQRLEPKLHFQAYRRVRRTQLVGYHTFEARVMTSYFSLSVRLCLVAARTRRHRPRPAHRKLSRTLAPIKALQENPPTVTEILGSFSDSILGPESFHVAFAGELARENHLERDRAVQRGIARDQFVTAQPAEAGRFRLWTCRAFSEAAAPCASPPAAVGTTAVVRL